MTELDEAFLAASFAYTNELRSIWRDDPTHVESLQAKASDAIMQRFGQLSSIDADNRIGQPVCGPAGSGKTHLLGTLRRRVHAAGGWFVLIDIVNFVDFWRTAAFGFIKSLRQVMPDKRWQSQLVFEAALKRIPAEALKNPQGKTDERGAVGAVNRFVRALQTTFPEATEHANVMRALLLQRDADVGEIAYNWLLNLDVSADDRKMAGLTGPSPAPDRIVAGAAWLMSLGGPIMIAVDQIDTLVVNNEKPISTASADQDDASALRPIVEALASGLMDLYDQTQRCLTVVTCLEETWSLLRHRALTSFAHRFAPRIELQSASNADGLARLIEGRLSASYARAGVTPPYPTWPFAPEAIQAVEGFWPRQTLMACDAFRLRCENAAAVEECRTLSEASERGPTGRSVDHARLAEAFETRRRAADIGSFRSPDEGGAMGELVRTTLALHVRQEPSTSRASLEVAAAPTDAKPALHARLAIVFHDQGDFQEHFCFRAMPHTHHLSVQSRLRAAMTDAGIDRRAPFRHLFILRDEPLPKGKVTADLVSRLLADGGKILSVSDDDLRAFVALRDMDRDRLDGFDAWLRQDKPLSHTAFFKAVGLSPPPTSPTQPPPPAGGSDPLDPPVPRPDPPRPDPPPEPPERKGGPKPPAALPLGVSAQGGRIVGLPISVLVRHTAIFAGSGSGKTVFLRRLVEEAALAGVPSIVLDPNNDLSRLGERWPARPDGFSDEDAAKAERYARDVEVVVWTPGAAAGRPLTLATLPDFPALAPGEDRDQAVTMAWATLAPLIAGSGQTKALKDGVLREALAAFAEQGLGGLDAFVEFLADLPADASRQTRAQKFAADMADMLRAKIAINPLLNAPGQPLDPHVLFTAERPGATRVSVVNLAALPDAGRGEFVNQLQMALFGYVRRRPSETPRLYVVDEAQTVAPSQASTASKASAVALAQQGRKYGLGMVLATQGPRTIETNIVGNCTTHLYGRMTSLALIEATQDMMAARGRAAGDLGKLGPGAFYVSTEGFAQPVRIQTPLCLSWHPPNPPSPDEVVALARRPAAGG